MSVKLSWISVKDELPPLGEYVFVWREERCAFPVRSILRAWLCADGTWKVFAKSQYIDPGLVTHWRPLFEKPLDDIDDCDNEDDDLTIGDGKIVIQLPYVRGAILKNVTLSYEATDES